MSELSDYAQKLKRELRRNTDAVYTRAEHSSRMRLSRIEDPQIVAILERFFTVMNNSLRETLEELNQQGDEMIDQLLHRYE